MGSMSPHRRRQQASDAGESDRSLGMPQSTQRLPTRRLSGYTADKHNPLRRGSLRASAALGLHLPTVSVQSDGRRGCFCDEFDSFGDTFHRPTWLEPLPLMSRHSRSAPFPYYRHGGDMVRARPLGRGQQRSHAGLVCLGPSCCSLSSV